MIISGAKRDIRNGTVAWTAETSYGQTGIYSIALSHVPLRVVADDVDLFRFKSFTEFLEQRTGSTPGPLQGWRAENGRVYVRLHPSGQNGSTNPAGHVMKLGAPIGGDFFGNTVN